MRESIIYQCLITIEFFLKNDVRGKKLSSINQVLITATDVPCIVR